MALLDDVKAHLRITDNDSDVLLNRLIASATREYISFTGVDATESTVPAEEDAVTGIILMVQAGYEGQPQDRNAYRDAAIRLWTPYRVNMGV